MRHPCQGACSALLSLTLVCCASAQDNQKTYAERLGWPAGARVLIFHSDDAGMCHEANVGTMEALDYGVLTSVSTMMPCPWVPEWHHYLQNNPDVDNGLHITLTSEWEEYGWEPLAGKEAVPGLTDEEGCMWDNVPLVVENASAEEVEKEIRAQVDRALTMGMPVTHLDTHMGTVFATPAFLLAYVKVGMEKNIPLMLPGGHMTHTMRENGDAVAELKASGIIETVWNAGLPILDDLHTGGYGWKNFEEKKAETIEFLRNLKPGVTQFIVHCTKVTPHFEAISTSGPTRQADLDLMTDPDIKRIIEEEGIILTTWRELKERRDKVQEES